MNANYLWRRSLTMAMALLLVTAGVAVAQLQTGDVFGVVTDAQGDALPGATVTLTGAAGAPRVTVTDAKGNFRIPALNVGSYALKAELEGFGTIDVPTVIVNVGRTTNLEITMQSAVEEVITVTSESPLMDPRKVTTGQTVNQTDLEKIPTARDPWAILQSVPGVLTDRINVGGNESGQQSTYVGPGSAGDQSVWSVDGVVITDMAALGSSPAYYDFDAFEEMQVTTGGSDVSNATGGVVLNMVTKRGTNEWRGSARYMVADQDWQGSLDIADSELGQGGAWNSNRPQDRLRQGNRIVDVKDYGVELGGPIVKDKVWIWGSYGRQKVDLLTVSDVSDFSDLETQNGKINVQLSSNNSAVGSWLDSDKVKIGRNASPFRPQPTTWDQSKFGDTPTSYKLEDTHIFSSNFFLTGLYSIVNGGFQLVPQGGDVTNWLDFSGVWQNTFVLYQTERPQEQFKADGSYFFSSGDVSHELKFGAGYRTAEVDTLSRWGGSGRALTSEYLGGVGLLYVLRDARPHAENEYTSAYIQDTLTVGNLTANVGLRYDLQDGKHLSSTARANSTFPNIVPSATYGGGDMGFEWESIVPRLGLTYAMGEDKKTLVRASYSRFADQLGIGPTYWLNPLYLYGYSYLLLYPDADLKPILTPSDVIDLDSNGVIDDGDTVGYQNMHPITKAPVLNNALDPNLDPPTTDELTLGIEHAIRPEFVVGVTGTYRIYSDILEFDRLVFDGVDAFDVSNLGSTGRRATRNDYVINQVPRPAGLPNGDSYTRTYFELKPGVTSRGGFYMYNGPAEQEYLGLSLTFNKRLANRWMMRGNFTFADWSWSEYGNEVDQTCFLGSPCSAQGDDLVVQGSGTGSGSKGGIYINSEWSYSINGMYQVAPDRPWGFNIAANLNGREGYPLPYFERTGFSERDGIPGYTRVQVVPADRFRLDDIHMLDARIEKEWRFDDFGFTLGVDCFNVLNEAYVLQRNHRLRTPFNPNNPTAPLADYVVEVTSPQIFRIGARFSFR